MPSAEFLDRIPVQIVGAVIIIIVLIWLFSAIKSLIGAVAGWRKDELGSAAALRAERDKELREAIEGARDSRQSESRWYGQYVEATEANQKLSGALRELEEVRARLSHDGIAMNVRLRLYEAFMESEVVSRESAAAWKVFKAMSDQARVRHGDRGEPAEGAD